MKHILSILALLALAGTAQAQTRNTACSSTTPNNALCLAWTAATQNTEGAAITGVYYRVQQRVGTTGQWTEIAPNVTALQYYVQNLAPGSYYFRVFVGCTGCTGESASSNVANGTATQNPNIPQPTTLIIAAVIHADGPPTYRIIQQVTLKPNEVVFTAPATMRPLFAAR
jgi:hypothetical protein